MQVYQSRMKKSNGYGVSPGIQEKLSHFSLFPKAKTIIDVGGQDIKAMKVDTTLALARPWILS